MNRSSWPAFLLFAAATLPVPHGRSDDRFSASAAPLDPIRRPTFSVPAEQGFYYQLRRSPSPTGPWSVTAMAKGFSGQLSLTDSIPALERAFFSIRRVPLSSPLDTDGDGLSDPAEWNAVNPTNPFHSGRFINAADGRSALGSLADYNALAHFDNFPGAPSVQEVKFLILNAHTAQPQLFFLNAARHQYHYYFARDVLGYSGSLSQFNGETYFSNTTRRNLAGSLVHHRNYLPTDGSPQGLITMEFWPSDAVSHAFVQKAYDLITRSAANTGVRFAYHAASETQRTLFRSERSLFTEAARHSLHTVRTEDLFGQTPYTLLNPGVGFGRLILFDGSSSISARDVVIFRSLPNDITHLAGIITEVPQTPLSHVNLKAKQNDTPNAFIRDAARDPRLAPLLGRYVRYETTSEGFLIREASPEEVESHLASIRPPNPQLPVRDLSITSIRSLSAISFTNARAFGAKTANVAELRRIAWSPNVSVPNGYGIPFYFYDEFMKANGLYNYAASLIAIPAFQSDPTFRADALKALRSAIRNGTVPDWITTALTSLQANFPAGTSLRCRSSTNNEDLTGYSGAGLYDSFTHYPSEGPLSKTVRQVWASVWEDRAFDEREFYRVDHFLTAMGVLVHPNFDGELANGVGVTRNLVDPAWTGYYINAQAGENLVTNPENNAVPEEFLIAQLLGQSRYTLQYVTFSSLMPEGQTVLSTPQAELLADQMAKIHNYFLPLYNYPPNFAMELEWKIDAAGKLVIKQARPWID